MSTVELSFLYCDKPNAVVRASIMDGTVTGLIATDVSVVEKWEAERPDDWHAMTSCVDSGTAIINKPGYVVVYQKRHDKFMSGDLYKCKKSDFIAFEQLKEGKTKVMNLDINCYMYNESDEYVKWTEKGTAYPKYPMGGRIEDCLKEYYTKESVEPAPSTGFSMLDGIGSMSEDVPENLEDAIHNQTMSELSMENLTQKKPTGNGEIMNPPTSTPIGSSEIVTGVTDVTAKFMCDPKSNLILSAKVLGKEIHPIVKSASDNFYYEADNRYPYTYIPCIWHGQIGYATYHTQIEKNNGAFELVPTEIGHHNYHFYPIVNDNYEYYPDALADVISSEHNLQSNVNLTGKVKIAVNGMKNLFSGEEESEQTKTFETLKRFYASFLLATKFFTITHVSWKTGLITAYTPNNNQVLLMACVKKKDMRDGLAAFIPIKKTVGLSVIGLDYTETKELERIWVANQSEE